MYNSIQSFGENGIKNLEEVFLQFVNNPSKFAEMVLSVQGIVVNLGLSMIAEELQMYDQYLRDNQNARPNWYIVKRDQTTLITSLGSVSYAKTLFKHKLTGERCYLLDKYMGIQPHIRITEDAEAKILQEASVSSYDKTGKSICLSGETISKETVMAKLHELKFPKALAAEEKKIVEYLYIDADEDHIHLQYRDRKGDLQPNEYGRKNNNAIAKLVYVYEGIEPETLHGKRHRLKNPHYFARVGKGEENNALWDEVYEYLDNTYVLDQVKTIYVNADGGEWIKSGIKRLGTKVKFVLDEFHLMKYLTKLCSHMKDTKDDVKAALCRYIRHGTKGEFQEYVNDLKRYLPDETGEKRIDDSLKYIMDNWTAAKNRLCHKDGGIGSSTEGHVSHILSARMSSRPMGWSIVGMSKMAELRAYYFNGGDMLELVRYQKQALNNSEEKTSEIYSARQMIIAENMQRATLGIYAGMKTYHVPYTVRKQAAIRHQIWDL